MTEPSDSEPLTLEAEISRATVEAGAPAVLTFRLRNHTSQTIRLSFATGCQVNPYIADRTSNAVVYPGGGAWACTLALTRLELPPNGSEVRQVRVAAAGSGAAADAVLVRGNYAAYARLEDSVHRLVSPTVQFSVP